MAWRLDRWYFRLLGFICMTVIVPGDASLYAQTQANSSTGSQGQFMTAEHLDSLLAPIALYPDSLLAQVLAASTYPLQIVTAERWVKQNSNFKEKELVQAAGKQPWDPSIQALVAFPTVLQMLDQNLDWTTALGNAFLAQQVDVMAAVQRMRAKAQDSGKLESNAQQQVQNTTVDGQPTIVVQSADPQVIYVPTYESASVYGPAPEYYPYPSMYYPTGAAVAAGVVSFGLGIAVGAIFNGCCGGGWGWGWGCNWGARPSLYVNNNFFAHNGNNFVNRGNWGNSYRGNGRAGWNHNPLNRGSVPYPNRDIANRFNNGRGGFRPTQLPSNIGNFRPPGSLGGGNRLPGNIGSNRPGGAGGSSLLPSNPGGINRPGGGRGGASQLPANRAGQGGRWGGWNGSNGPRGNGGSAFRGGSTGQARSFSNRGGRSMGGGSFGGGGGRRGGGRRR
jgi:hypothetical protein